MSHAGSGVRRLANAGHLLGHISWINYFIPSCLLLCLAGPTTEVCFCFYSHCNVLLARSPRLTVVNPEASPSSGRDPLTRNAITEPFQIRVTGVFVM